MTLIQKAHEKCYEEHLSTSAWTSAAIDYPQTQLGQQLSPTDLHSILEHT